MKQDLDVTLASTLKDFYGLRDLSLKTPEEGLESNTYIIASATQKFVAKLYSSQKRAEAIALFQHNLKISDLPAPEVLKTLDGSLIAKYYKENYLVLSEYVDGEPLGWSAHSAHITPRVSGNLATNLAKMHKLSDATEIDYPLGADNILRLQNSNPETKRLQDMLTKVRKTMVHGDLTRENIFLNTQQSAVKSIIDFGDAHFDYITYDIAILLTQVYVTKSWGIDFDGIQNFLATYPKYNELTVAEKNTILPLMKVRNIGLLKQIESELGNSSADHETLESICNSLKTKLELLAKNQSRLEMMFTAD